MATGIGYAVISIIAAVVAYLLGRRRSAPAPTKEKPDETIAKLDANVDAAASVPVDDAVAFLEQRARARERRRGSNPTVPPGRD